MKDTSYCFGVCMLTACWHNSLMVVGIVQESRPGSLFGPAVKGKWAERSLCGGGEHQDHPPVLSDGPYRHEGDHHESG